MEEKERDIEKCQCYYEILGVEKNATIEDIKKNYKKLILNYHPDKNSNRSEEELKRYTHIFRKIQESYECLIDERRRKWYDVNRNKIIRGREEEEEREGNQTNSYSNYKVNINIWGYFNNNCFSGYDDNCEKSFYNVYRKLFDDIIKEENEELNKINKINKNNKENPISAPSFGNSQTCGKSIDEFYEYWSNFSTVKKFDFFNEYLKSYEFENRHTRRNLKKENEKKSIKERKNYNENIRSLVQHLKQYDTRYLNRVVQIVEEKRKKQEEKENIKKQQLLERKLLFEQTKKKWEEEQAAHCEEEEDLSDHNKNKREFSLESSHNYYESSGNEHSKRDSNLKRNDYINDDEHQNDSNSDHSIKQNIIYRCEVCKKNFKTMKHYNSHEKSKKHITNFLKSTRNYNLDDIFGDVGNGEENDIENDDEIKVPKKKKKKKKKNPPTLSFNNIENSGNSSSENIMKNDDYLSWCTNDKKKYKYKFLDEKDGVKEDISSSTSDEQAKSFEKTDHVTNFEDMDKDIGKCKDTPTNITTKDNSKNLKCQICNQSFDSRNKLFDHIKAEGHMANKIIVPPSKAKKKNKKKGE
ncbi:DnaJ protein, putative [Plasmodium chabaudi chabaudi]|uniref:DnaJ protein, putative n=1 Tax=Plasmodium chabaudi chabaudi TaxID=31271 RepID=A0A1C6YLM3_PLACU|nr:DnaJ protein, putative [Plasmodium chabaudi chabaudi]